MILNPKYSTYINKIKLTKKYLFLHFPNNKYENTPASRLGI